MDNFILKEQDRQKTICRDIKRLLEALVTERQMLNTQCEQIAALIDPSSRGTFQYPAEVTPYDPKTDQQVDATGMLALDRFMAISDSLLSPKNLTWHWLTTSDPYVKKDRASRMWLYNTTRRLFELRYSQFGNFTANNQAVYKSLGAYGTGVLFIDGYYDIAGRTQAIRYKQIPWGEVYLTQNHQGVYDGWIRIIRFTAQEAMKMPGWKAKLEEVPAIKMALEQNSQRKFVFLHRICPRDDYDPSRYDEKGKLYASYYIYRDGDIMLSEGGYHTRPFAASRYIQAPGERDGRSIAMSVLPALKTLNSQKKTFLKQGHRAADPPILLSDDGLVNFNNRPGAQNKGMLSNDGKPLAVPFVTAGANSIQINEVMMGEEKSLIENAFLVQLFSILNEKNGMTATEVIERINEKGILIAPTLGRQEGEYFGWMIDRELDLMAQMMLLDPMPQRLAEAGGTYKIHYDSPLAKASRMQEAAGFFRTLEGVKELVNITGDQSLLDPFAFDRAIPEIADMQSVPEPWMATPEERRAKAEARARAMAMEQQIKAAPAAAAMMKAQVAAAKEGVGVNPASRDLAPGAQPSIAGVA